MKISSPTIECGECQFTNYLAGTWSVEDGHLVWRGEHSLTPWRGPDLDRCGEGSHCNLDRRTPPGVMLDDEPMSDEDYASLLATDRATCSLCGGLREHVRLGDSYGAAAGGECPNVDETEDDDD
jgi:hypothetical protein